MTHSSMNVGNQMGERSSTRVRCFLRVSSLLCLQHGQLKYPVHNGTVALLSCCVWRARSYHSQRPRAIFLVLSSCQDSLLLCARCSVLGAWSLLHL